MANRRVLPSVRPVSSYLDPDYPTLTIHKENPGWLLYHAPPSWLRKDVALGALVTFALGGVSGVQGPQTQSEVQGTQTRNATTLLTERQKPRQSRQEPVSIAPVFVHGEGRGSTGCVAVAAPVFLSEDEAMEIILDELKNEGIDFDQRDHLLCDVSAPSTSLFKGLFPEEADGREAGQPARRAMTIDLFSSASNLGICFVSARDFVRLSYSGRFGASVSVYDTLDLAQRIKETLEKAGEIDAAVFYDPQVIYAFDGKRGPERWRTSREEALEEARELLRAQVRDFVTWMKKNIHRPAVGGL